MQTRQPVSFAEFWVQIPTLANKNRVSCLKRKGIALLLFILVVMLLFAFLSQMHEEVQRHLDFVLGVCTHGNESSELYALRHGVRYFRTDIGNSKNQESLLTMEHSIYNASYLMNGSAYNYYVIIKSASGIIKAREPNAKIVCFGGAPIADYQAMLWYRQVWSYGAAKYCDAISIHAYPYGPELLSSTQITAWMASIQAYENFTHKPIWITEFGMPSSSKEIPGKGCKILSWSKHSLFSAIIAM